MELVDADYDMWIKYLEDLYKRMCFGTSQTQEGYTMLRIYLSDNEVVEWAIDLIKKQKELGNLEFDFHYKE